MKIICQEIFTSHVGISNFPQETNVIEGQECNISELLERFTKNQRLNVHQRPMNDQVEEYDLTDEFGNVVGHHQSMPDDDSEPVQIDSVDDLLLYTAAQRAELEAARVELSQKRNQARQKPQVPPQEPPQDPPADQ